jgi:5-methyltetrahydropteroyltriglutamate--homocysteine methyltransferase
VPLERLAISPQCGFATSIIGNQIALEDEKQKLETLVQTAQEVWQSA